MRIRGFNLIESLVIVAIVVASAGIVVPMFARRHHGTAEERVRSDLHRLAVAMQKYIHDTRSFPTGHTGATNYHWLMTSGIHPTNNVFDSGPSMLVDRFLRENGMAGPEWNGPYLFEDLGPDPWGRAYIVNVNGYFNSAERVIVLCAGPNGQVNTAATASTAGGDDIMVVLD